MYIYATGFRIIVHHKTINNCFQHLRDFNQHDAPKPGAIFRREVSRSSLITAFILLSFFDRNMIIPLSWQHVLPAAAIQMTRYNREYNLWNKEVMLFSSSDRLDVFAETL